MASNNKKRLGSPRMNMTCCRSGPGKMAALSICLFAVVLALHGVAHAEDYPSRPIVLVVHPSTPAASVQELIAFLKSKPGTPAGHAGIGTTPHLSLETFRRMAGVEITMVPFKGGGEAQQGILGGQVPFMFSTTIGIL